MWCLRVIRQWRQCTMLRTVWDHAWPYSGIPLPTGRVLEVVLPDDSKDINPALATAKLECPTVQEVVWMSPPFQSMDADTETPSCRSREDPRAIYWQAMHNQFLMHKSPLAVRPVTEIIIPERQMSPWLEFSPDGEILAIRTSKIVRWIDFSCGFEYTLPVDPLIYTGGNSPKGFSPSWLWAFHVEYCLYEGQRGYLLLGSFSCSEWLDIVFVATPVIGNVPYPEAPKPIGSIPLAPIPPGLDFALSPYQIAMGSSLFIQEAISQVDYSTRIIDLAKGRSSSIATLFKSVALHDDALLDIVNGRVHSSHPFKRHGRRDKPLAWQTLPPLSSDRLDWFNHLSPHAIYDSSSNIHVLPAWRVPTPRTGFRVSPFSSCLYAIPPFKGDSDSTTADAAMKDPVVVEIQPQAPQISIAFPSNPLPGSKVLRTILTGSLHVLTYISGTVVLEGENIHIPSFFLTN
ncbi:hypothetical protein DL93DRAFT_2225172 [Clavulina sp. PMI_390]|nr:hypothetical protein DL93DRAFT_2225172 [Clavulina sp. PMI_390]